MDRRKLDKHIRGTGSGAFAVVTVVAVVMAIVLIALGRVSIPRASVNVFPSTTSVPTATLSSTPVITPSMTSAVTPINLAMSKGSANAPVTIIEYSDFQCAHCQNFALTTEKELEATYIDTGKVRLIYRFITAFGEESQRANQAAACAAEQGQFWNYYYLLMMQRAHPNWLTCQ